MAGLFEVGPFADLVGRRPKAVGLAGSSGLTARLNDPEKLQEVDPGDGTVPALISGALTGPGPDSLFRPGANRVRLYQVEGTRAGPRLHPVAVAT